MGRTGATCLWHMAASTIYSHSSPTRGQAPLAAAAEPEAIPLQPPVAGHSVHAAAAGNPPAVAAAAMTMATSLGMVLCLFLGLALAWLRRRLAALDRAEHSSRQLLEETMGQLRQLRTERRARELNVDERFANVWDKYENLARTCGRAAEAVPGVRHWLCGTEHTIAALQWEEERLRHHSGDLAPH